MRLIVEAPVSAGLLRTDRDDDVMLAALVVRKRFVLGDDRLDALPEPKEPPGWIRYDAIDRGEYGELPADEIPPRTGTDVIVLGNAVSREPVIATRVAVEVGEYKVDLDVFGDRIWETAIGALVPSDPIPFSSMPLTYANAFGGATEGEYGPIPYYMNPSGKGYYIRASEAKGKPLPNVEASGTHIRAWDDRPPPAGFAPYPSTWGLKWEKFVEVDPEREEINVHPERGMYDRAHPALSGKRVDPGPMRIAGMSPRSIQFDVPACPVEAHITVSGQTVVKELSLEEILVDIPARQVDLTWRKMFRYRFVKYDRRETRVVEKTRTQR